MRMISTLAICNKATIKNIKNIRGPGPFINHVISAALKNQSPVMHFIETPKRILKRKIIFAAHHFDSAGVYFLGQSLFINNNDIAVGALFIFLLCNYSRSIKQRSSKNF